MEFDLTRQDSDQGAFPASPRSLTQTVSISLWSPLGPRRRRRLVLTSSRVQDSHDQRLARVRRTIQAKNQDRASRRAVEDAEGLITSLAACVGLRRGGDIPQILRRQQWSALNVPLMCAAACGDSAQFCSGLPIQQAQFQSRSQVSPFQDLKLLELGSSVCRNLSEWVHRQGFSQHRLVWPPQWQGSGTHFEWCRMWVATRTSFASNRRNAWTYGHPNRGSS